MSQSYTYSILNDFPGSPNGVCYESNLTLEIQASSIATALDSIGRIGDVLTITFVSQLSAGDKTTLDNNQTGPAGGLIAAHNSTPPPVVQNTYDRILTTAVLSNNLNDANPMGFATTSIFRVQSSLAINITGLAGGTNGRSVTAHNVGSFNITLTHEDTNSSAANRFNFPGASSMVLTPNKAIVLQYDSASARWRALASDDPYGTTANTACQGNDARLNQNNSTGSDPAATNDNTQGYSVGSRWTNTSTDTTWFCVDATTNAAVWRAVSLSGEKVLLLQT